MNIAISFRRGTHRLLLLWCMLLPLWLSAQKEIPKPSGFLVNDYAGLFTREQVVALGEKLEAYAKETSTQIVVVTEKSLEGDDPFDYSVRLAQEWGIGGSEEKDNGVLIYVASEDRKIRIQTGYGAEGFLPDAIAKRIIDETIAPAFRKGEYYEGIDAATTEIMQRAKGEFTASPGDGSRETEIPGWVIVLIVIIIIIIISKSNKRGGDRGYSNRGPYTHRYPGGWWIFPGGGFGSGGGGWGGSSSNDGWGGFGGGDFGGFGGGDFGGGGAGGDW